MEVGYNKIDTDCAYVAIERYKGQTTHATGTQQLYLVTFKQFLTWLIDDERNEKLKPARIAKIGTHMPTSLKTENDVLTGEELEKVFKAMKNLRDRALDMLTK